jgi:hypothetical protein
MPQKNSLIFLSGTSFLVRDTITIAVVRLSSNAERKKVTQHITHNKVFGFFVGNSIRDYTESMISIDKFDDGHGTHQKKKNCGYFAQMLCQLLPICSTEEGSITA